MLADELKERLKLVEPDLATITTFWEQSSYASEYEKLTTLTNEVTFWQNPDQATISKKLKNIRELIETYTTITKNQKELYELIELFETDEQELTKLGEETRRHCKNVAKFKLSLLLDKDNDNSNCFFSVNSGAGGTESQDWAEILLRMYVRFCEREGFDANLVDYQSAEGAGIKGATLFIRGKNAYGFLKNEQGIHRLVRVSPFDANKRRHTSFAAALCIPEVPDVAVTINPADLRIDTFRAGGAGGQHVNKTESAIRITHIPTNTVVQCQNERSQAQNKDIAMKMLMAKLVQRQEEEKAAQYKTIEKKAIEWGSQIRSYVLHPYKMVKDHRTDLESPQPDNVLDGDIMPFIEANLLLEHKK